MCPVRVRLWLLCARAQCLGVCLCLIRLSPMGLFLWVGMFIIRFVLCGWYVWCVHVFVVCGAGVDVGMCSDCVCLCV